MFSDATGVASVIISPDGTHLTHPSNFCRLFTDIIYKSEKGISDYLQFIAFSARNDSSGLAVVPYMTGGFLGATVRITVDGTHFANWLIGQVRNEEMDEQQMLLYCDNIGAGRDEFSMALKEVPVMSVQQFNKVSQMLNAFAGELSEKAYNALQLKLQIGERQKANELLFALQNERLLLRTLIDNIPDSIYSKDLACRKTLVNLAELGYLGANSEAEVLGKNDFDFYPKELAEKFFADDQLVMQSGKPVINREEYVLDGQGQKRWLLSSKLPLRDKDNQIIGLVGIGRDITERKQVEEKLVIAREKTEEGNQLKTAFLKNIAHEIRTPFSGILGFLSILQTEGLTGNERDEYLSIISQSSNRLMHTISDIVEISQIETGQVKLILAETNIQGLLDQLFVSFTPEVESKGLQLNVNNELSDKIERIYTDGVKLHTILSNLLGNAVKFTKTGSIDLNCKLKITNNAGDDTGPIEPAELEFTVTDSGIGIPAYKLERVFEQFMQADVSNTRQYEGSGLGLSIAKAYVEMLGGRIWVNSEEGMGSVFGFTLPMKDRPDEQIVHRNADTANVSGSQIKSLKILIAEDDEGSAYLITMAVKMFGKEVIRVKTGVEAVEACRNNADIDLVMMDIKMPDMDGDEAARQIRQFNKDVVIIAQTAYAMTVDRQMAIDAGCNDYITKPIKKDNLVVMVHNYFKKQE